MDISSDALEAFVEGNMDFGMTHEQIKNFVVNSHVTNRRKLRQVLVEVSTRNHERKKLRLDIERKQVKIDELTARLETVDDPYERRFIEIDIEEYKLDMGRFRITLHQADNELQAFMDWIHKNYGEMDEVVQDAEYDEDEERKYWKDKIKQLRACFTPCFLNKLKSDIYLSSKKIKKISTCRDYKNVARD